MDLLGPDLYAVSAFDYVMQGYDQPGNPVLMPETRPTPDGAARAFYAFGKYNMLCYSPFGIDGNGYSLDPATARMRRHTVCSVTCCPPLRNTREQAGWPDSLWREQMPQSL